MCSKDVDDIITNFHKIEKTKVMNIISRTRKGKTRSLFQYVGVLVVFTVAIQNGSAVRVKSNRLENDEIGKYT